ncbi:hypothetical protein FJT64_019092 [Amphibalanus amphitrite]|uniref:Uncharacterized protein n=1 Tax=Amphibalanus amphitrite TaxID=1232801 RepID=A0A6A4X4N6_AMPAM|nr:hypothetical protein FJT64_019092 [Amphibalanus amphitrite]
MLSNSSGPAEPHGALPAGYQLGFLLLAAVAAVPPVCVARDIVAGRRRLSPVDEILLFRVLAICFLVPFSACFVVLRAPAQRWLTQSQRHVACTAHSLVVVTATGSVVATNFVVSLSRAQQVAASGVPALAARLTGRWVRRQNRLLLALLSAGFAALVLLGVPPSSYFWCAAVAEPARPPMHLLLSLNSGLNFGTFALCVFLLRTSFGLQATARPANYLPALSWAQLCLVIITANALLAPLNLSDFDSGEKTFLNHAFFVFLYGLLDPCLMLCMASRWRQQAREHRLHAARTRIPPKRNNIVIPVIKLELI